MHFRVWRNKFVCNPIEWIKTKEQTLAEMPASHTIERYAYVDYEAFETRDRTYYLIENYME